MEGIHEDVDLNELPDLFDGSDEDDNDDHEGSCKVDEQHLEHERTRQHATKLSPAPTFISDIDYSHRVQFLNLKLGKRYASTDSGVVLQLDRKAMEPPALQSIQRENGESDMAFMKRCIEAMSMSTVTRPRLKKSIKDMNEFWQHIVTKMMQSRK